MKEYFNEWNEYFNILIKYCQKLSEKNLKHFEHGKASDELIRLIPN
jgi:hypothetical protein